MDAERVLRQAAQGKQGGTDEVTILNQVLVAPLSIQVHLLEQCADMSEDAWACMLERLIRSDADVEPVLQAVAQLSYGQHILSVICFLYAWDPVYAAALSRHASCIPIAWWATSGFMPLAIPKTHCTYPGQNIPFDHVVNSVKEALALPGEAVSTECRDLLRVALPQYKAITQADVVSKADASQVILLHQLDIAREEHDLAFRLRMLMQMDSLSDTWSPFIEAYLPQSLVEAEPWATSSLQNVVSIWITLTTRSIFEHVSLLVASQLSSIWRLENCQVHIIQQLWRLLEHRTRPSLAAGSKLYAACVRQCERHGLTRITDTTKQWCCGQVTSFICDKNYALRTLLGNNIKFACFLLSEEASAEHLLQHGILDRISALWQAKVSEKLVLYGLVLICALLEKASLCKERLIERIKSSNLVQQVLMLLVTKRTLAQVDDTLTDTLVHLVMLGDGEIYTNIYAEQPNNRFAVLDHIDAIASRQQHFDVAQTDKLCYLVRAGLAVRRFGASVASSSDGITRVGALFPVAQRSLSDAQLRLLEGAKRHPSFIRIISTISGLKAKILADARPSKALKSLISD